VTSPKKVNLALQGGGAHGAFVWGVLDELLEDGRLSIDAISATSAGAMNAVAFAYGMTVGGPKAARDKLEEFWRAVSRMDGCSVSPGRPSTAWRKCSACRPNIIRRTRRSMRRRIWSRRIF